MCVLDLAGHIVSDLASASMEADTMQQCVCICPFSGDFVWGKFLEANSIHAFSNSRTIEHAHARMHIHSRACGQDDHVVAVSRLSPVTHGVDVSAGFGSLRDLLGKVLATNGETSECASGSERVGVGVSVVCEASE